jgi:hypothetical protein
MLPAQIRRLHPRLVLLHNPDDLLFREPALLHQSPLLHSTRELQFPLAEFSGGRSPDIPGVTQAFIGFLPWSEYKKLIIDDAGNMKGGL